MREDVVWMSVSAGSDRAVSDRGQVLSPLTQHQLNCLNGSEGSMRRIHKAKVVRVIQCHDM